MMMITRNEFLALHILTLSLPRESLKILLDLFVAFLSVPRGFFFVLVKSALCHFKTHFCLFVVMASREGKCWHLDIYALCYAHVFFWWCPSSY